MLLEKGKSGENYNIGGSSNITNLDLNGINLYNYRPSFLKMFPNLAELALENIKNFQSNISNKEIVYKKYMTLISASS